MSTKMVRDCIFIYKVFYMKIGNRDILVSVAEPGLPEGRQFRVENKVFYFDIGQNNRGIFMRVSEVSRNNIYASPFSAKIHLCFAAGEVEFSLSHYRAGAIVASI